MTWPISAASSPIVESGGSRVREVRTATLVSGSGTLQFARYDKTTGAFVADIAGAVGASPLSYTLTAADQPYAVHAYVPSYQPSGTGAPVSFNVPVPVTNLIAQPAVGGGAVVLTYTAPTDTAPSNGGSAITSITAVDSRTGNQYTLTGSPFTISGLNNGDGRMFTVFVNNAIGASAPTRSNYVTPAPLAALQAPVQLDDTSSIVGWTAGGTTTQLIDTTGGVNTLQLTGGGSGSSFATKTLTNVLLTPSTFDVLATIADLVSNISAISSLSPAFIRGGSSGQGVVSNASTQFRGGRHPVGISIDDPAMAAIKALNTAGTLQFRPKADQITPFTSVVRWQGLWSNCRGRALYNIEFDDIPDSQYYTVFPLLEARGLKAKFNVPVNFVGQPGRMTYAMLREMSEAGHCIALNTPDDTFITTGFASDAALTAAMLAAAATLLANVPRAYLGGMALSNGAWSEARLVALAAANIRTARTTNPDILWLRAGWGNQALTYPSQGGTPSTPVATFTAGMTKAKQVGALWSMHLHDVSDTPTSIGYRTANLVLILDAIVADIQAGLAVNYTMDVIDALVSTYSTSNFGQ